MIEPQTLAEITLPEPLLCWCGHSKEQHGKDNKYTMAGYYREDGCLQGCDCDEFQIF